MTTTTFLPLLAGAAFKGAIILLIAALAVRAMGRASAAMRHMVWLLAVVAILVLPALSAVLPEWRVLPRLSLALRNSLPQREGQGTDRTPELVAQDYSDQPHARFGPPPHLLPTPPRDEAGGLSSFGTIPKAEGIEPAASLERAHPMTWPFWITIMWLGGVAACLAAPVLGALSLRRLGQTAQRVTDLAILDLLADQKAKLGMKRRIVLLKSDSRTMPMTWGVFRPKLLLPASMLKREGPGSHSDPVSEQSAIATVLLHELAHIKRHDCLAQWLTHLARALHWFNPLAWYAAARMAAEREQACDDMVLTAGSDPPTYAQELLSIASALRTPGFAAHSSIAMARSSKLEGRLLGILDATKNRRTMSRGAIITATVLLVATVLPVAMMRAENDAPARQDEAASRSGPSTTAVKLDNGATIELIAIAPQPFPQKDPKWWRPDGSPLLPAPEDEPTWVGRTQRELDELVVETLFRLSGPGVDEMTVTMEGGSLSTRRDAGSDTREWFTTAVVPLDVESATLRLRVATGPWETVGRSTGKGTGGASVGKLEVAYAPAHEKIQRTTITATFKVGDKDFRVVAVDKEGEIHTSTEIGTSGISDFVQLTVTFNLPLEQIREFLFQVRPFKSIEFRNVSLKPGHRTEVEVVETDRGRDAAQAEQVANRVAAAVEPAAPSTSALTVTLDDGTKVELLGLAPHPSKGQSWWKPDGSPLSHAPLMSAESAFESFGPDERAVEAVCRVYGGRVEGRMLFSAVSGRTIPRTRRTRSGETDLVAIARLPKNADVAALRVRIATAWQVVARSEGEVSYPVGEADGEAVFSVAEEKNGTTVIAVASNFQEGEVRVIALDHEGAEHLPRGTDVPQPVRSIQQMTAYFDLPKEKIASFEFQVSPVTEIEFRNVSLKPGHRTHVVVVEADRGRDAAEAEQVANRGVAKAEAAVPGDAGSDLQILIDQSKHGSSESQTIALIRKAAELRKQLKYDEALKVLAEAEKLAPDDSIDRILAIAMNEMIARSIELRDSRRAARAAGAEPAARQEKVVVADMVERLAQITTHNDMAFGIGNQIAGLPPEVGYEIAETIWPRLANDDAKTGLLKVFAFSRHPRVLDVLHLGVTDESVEVQNYAFRYLHNYAFRNFAEDYEAYFQWRERYAGKTVEQVIEANAHHFVDELKKTEGADRAVWVRRLGPKPLDLQPGNKTTYPRKREYLLDAGLLDVMTQWATDPQADDDTLDGAVAMIYGLRPDPDYVRRVIAPLVGKLQTRSGKARHHAVSAVADTKTQWALDLLTESLIDAVARRDQGATFSAAGGLARMEDLRAVPVMIGLIEADNEGDRSQNATYWVGWFGLNWLGVSYDETHDGAWWRQWWAKNKARFPQDIQELEIPDLKERIHRGQQKAEEASQPLEAQGDADKKYFLFGIREDLPAPSNGYKLLIAMPGGAGGADFRGFMENIYHHALSKEYLLVQLIAPEWSEDQFNRLVWPTETDRWPGMRFSTEQFVLAVIADVKAKYKVDARHVYMLGWSSGGPPTYAMSLHESGAVRGAIVAMTVFLPQNLPPLERANGRAYYILHSPTDFIAMSHPESARDRLGEAGATTKLVEYAGGHGWHGDVFGLIQQGVQWLESQ